MMRYNIATTTRGGYAMEYLSVAKTAEKWDISQRSVRNYCAEGRVPGAFLTGKTWNIPADAEKPDRIKRKDAAPAALLDILKEERSAKRTGGIYHKRSRRLCQTCWCPSPGRS